MEKITLGTDKRGQLTIKCSQIQNYQFRGFEHEDMNFLDFVVDTYEELLPQQNEGERNVADEQDQELVSRHCSRPPNKRSRYLPHHPKHSTHC